MALMDSLQSQNNNKNIDAVESSGEGGVIEGPLEEDVYEAVEKKLILKYNISKNVSIRAIIKDKVWRNAIEAVDAKVLSVIQQEDVVAYLLSESSLFVFRDRICLKTCGTTRIFNSVEIIISAIATYIPEINLIRIKYSRPTYILPKCQFKGYNEGFEKEVEILRKLTAEVTARSWKSVIHNSGKGITFHSSTIYPDNGLFKPFVHKGGLRSAMVNRENLTMDLAMFDLDSSKTEPFFGQKVEALKDSCIKIFLPKDSQNLEIDEYNFEPCGYSLNALGGEYFWCIHISPEPQFSYLSFETNHPSALDINRRLKEFYAPQKAIVLWTDEKLDDWITCNSE